MKQVWLISDTHFAHHKMYEAPFLREDGIAMRPFASSQDADEFMVDQWNCIVKPQDKVYHLGDVAMKKEGVEVLSRLNGDKVLIAGNHCVSLLRHLSKHFREIRPYWNMDGILFSHIPVHPGSVGRYKGNVHGHLHHREICLDTGEADQRYFNVSVERIDYTPISWDIVKGHFASLTAS